MRKDLIIITASKKSRPEYSLSLTRHDCLNKQNISEIQSCWHLKSLVLDLPLNKIEIKPVGFLDSSDQNGLIKGILFFYLFSAKFAFINYKKERAKSNFSYSFKTTLMHKFDIYKFLCNYFFENSLLTGKEPFYREGRVSNNNLSLNVIFKGSFFSNINYLLERLFTDFRIGSLNLKTSFLFKNVKSGTELSSLIPNNFMLFS